MLYVFGMLKKYFLEIAFVTIFLTLSAWASDVYAHHTSKQYRINVRSGSCLHMRSRATSRSRSKKCVRSGQKVTYLSRRGNWIKVRYGNRTGYVYKKYVRSVPNSGNGGSGGNGGNIADNGNNGDSGDSGNNGNNGNNDQNNGDIPYAGTYHVDINYGCLNVRSQPKKGKNQIACASKNKTLQVIGKNGDYLKVQYGARQGYVHKDHMKKGRYAGNDNNGGSNDAPKAGDCRTKMRKASRVSHYFTPVLPRYNHYRCAKMEGACIIRKKGQPDKLFNVGVGTQIRSEAKNGCHLGYGSRGNCLYKYKVVAADPRYYKRGDIIYFPKLRGRKIGGQYHDGYVQVADVGSWIKGRGRFDFFTSECTKFNSADQCLSNNGSQYDRLLTKTAYCKASKRSYQTALLDSHPDRSSQTKTRFAEGQKTNPTIEASDVPDDDHTSFL